MMTMDDNQRILTRMLVSTINAREVEANRVSRALHDEVGQVLSAVGLQMHVLKLDYQAQIPELVERVNEIQTILDTAVQRVRTLSYDLNPAVVERAGLQNALDRLVGRFRSEYKGSLRYLYHPGLRLPLEVGNAWYKIAELVLDNAVKHASADRIEIHVRPTPQAIIMEIRDNGIGFSLPDAKLKAAGLGLLLIEHYAAQAPINLVMKSTPGKGSLVRSSFPLPGAESDPSLDQGSGR